MAFNGQGREKRIGSIANYVFYANFSFTSKCISPYALRCFSHVWMTGSLLQFLPETNIYLDIKLKEKLQNYFSIHKPKTHLFLYAYCKLEVTRTISKQLCECYHWFWIDNSKECSMREYSANVLFKYHFIHTIYDFKSQHTTTVWVIANLIYNCRKTIFVHSAFASRPPNEGNKNIHRFFTGLLSSSHYSPFFTLKNNRTIRSDAK